MPDRALDIEDTLDITQVDTDLLRALAERIAASSSWSHFIYREAEVDQVWRLLGNPAATPGLPADVLRRVRERIMRVHDLIGIEHKPREAAVELLAAINGY